MKIGMTQLTVRDMCSLEQCLELCQQVGYDALELFFFEGGDPDIDLSADEIHTIGRRCREKGIAVSSLLAWFAQRGSLLSTDSQVQEQGLRELERSLEIAGMIGTGVVLLNPGRLEAEETYSRVYDRFLGMMRDMIPTAKGHNAVIGLENVWNRFLLSPKEMREFLDDVGSPWVKSYLDVANMRDTGYPEHWLHELREHIVRVHVKDYSYRTGSYVPFGEGDLDWRRIVKILKEIEYDGYIIHEIPGGPELQPALADTMRRLFQ